MAENTSGLRGFGAGVVGVDGAGMPQGPIVASELRLVDAVVQTETLTGNARTLFVDIEGHDAATDLTYRLGMTAGQPIDLFEPTAVGTWVAYNTGAAPIDRFILRPHWREGFYQGLRQVTLIPGRLELHVFDTGTGESVAVEVPISPETVRLYADGQAEPLPPPAIIDEAGAVRLLLHDREVLVERIEIDVPQALLAAHAPGPLADDPPPLDEESWYEDRPGQFEVLGRGPDAGVLEPDDAGIVGGGDIGPDGGGDGGEPSGCAVSTPAGSGGGWLLVFACGAVLGRRRRRG